MVGNVDKCMHLCKNKQQLLYQRSLHLAVMKDWGNLTQRPEQIKVKGESGSNLTFT